MGRARREDLHVLGPYFDKTKGLYRITVVNPSERDDDGKPLRIQRTFPTQAEAERERAKALGEIKAGQETSIEQVIGLWERQYHIDAKENDERHIENTKYRLGLFYFGDVQKLPIGAADEKLHKELRTGRYRIVPGKTKPEKIADGLATRPLPKTKEPPSKTHQLNILAQVRTFTRWCVSQGFMRKDPMAWFDPKMEAPREHGRLGNSKLKAGQAREMALYALDLATTDRCQTDMGIRAAAVSLALVTGLRASSIVRLDVDSIQRNAGAAAGDPWILRFQRAKKRSQKKLVEVELDEVFEPILGPLLLGRTPDAPLFTTTRPRGARVGSSRISDEQAEQMRTLSTKLSTAELARRFGVSWTAASRVLSGETHGDVREGKRPGRDWVADSVAKVCDLAGVPRDTAHAIRGQIADRGARAGNLEAAQRLLGHERLSTTLKSYASARAVSAGKQTAFLRALAGGKK